MINRNIKFKLKSHVLTVKISFKKITFESNFSIVNYLLLFESLLKSCLNNDLFMKLSKVLILFFNNF